MNFNPKAPPVYKPNPQRVAVPPVFHPLREGTTIRQSSGVPFKWRRVPAPRLIVQHNSKPACNPSPASCGWKHAGARQPIVLIHHRLRRNQLAAGSIQQKTKSAGATRAISQFLPIQRAQAAAAAAVPKVVNVRYSAALHKDALLAANVQAVSTFFHANEAGILPKGKQSRLWSPYIEFNLAKKYNLGARAVFDVVDKKIF